MLTLCYHVDGKKVRLWGDPSKTALSLKAMMKALKTIEQGYLLELEVVGPQGTRKSEENEDLKQPLAEYESLFAIPNQLPPKRDREQTI